MLIQSSPLFLHSGALHLDGFIKHVVFKVFQDIANWKIIFECGLTIRRNDVGKNVHVFPPQIVYYMIDTCCFGDLVTREVLHERFMMVIHLEFIFRRVNKSSLVTRNLRVERRTHR